MDVLEWQKRYREKINGRGKTRVKLDDDDRREILKLLRAGRRCTDIAREFGVSNATVSRISTGQRKVKLDE